MKLNKVFRYRLNLTPHQKKIIDTYIEGCRLAYNETLAYCRHDYEIAKYNFYKYKSEYPDLFDNAIPSIGSQTITEDGKKRKYSIPSLCYQHGGRVRSQGKGMMSTYKYLPEIKKKFPFLQDISIMILMESQFRVGRAFDSFFNGRGRYPKFHKKGSYNSITYMNAYNNCKFDESTGILNLPKSDIGNIRVIYHRPINGKIKTINIIKEPTGKYYASLTTEYDISDDMPLKNHIIVGIDRNIKKDDTDISNPRRSFCTLSTGEEILMPRFYQRDEKDLKRLQRKASKLTKGSMEWREIQKRVGRVHERIRFRKKDFLNRESKKIVDKYGIIAIEDLKIKDLTKRKKYKNDEKPDPNKYKLLGNARKIRKGFSETSHGIFGNMLEQKSQMYGSKLIKVPSPYTTQTCSNCKSTQPMELSNRIYKCQKCGLEIDRDLNAAINIEHNSIDELAKYNNLILASELSNHR